MKVTTYACCGCELDYKNCGKFPCEKVKILSVKAVRVLTDIDSFAKNDSKSNFPTEEVQP